MMRKELSNRSWKDKGIGTISNTLSLFIITIMILALLFFLYPIKTLQATDFQTGNYLKSWRVRNRDTFGIEYIHSVEKSPVLENYIIDGKDIILLDTYFQSFGAGLPATTPYSFEKTERGFRVYDINEEMEDLVYRVGSAERNHRLIFKNKEYKLLDFSEHKMGVKLSVKNMIRLSYIVKEGGLF